jgi:hypothetical protein
MLARFLAQGYFAHDLARVTVVEPIGLLNPWPTTR